MSEVTKNNISSPVKDPYIITSPYGDRTLKGKKQFHSGLDFISETNENTVFAIYDGWVTYDQDNYDESLRWVDRHHSGGNMVIIKHRINDVSYYARYLHLLDNYIKKDQPVKAGQKIGVYADVGISYGAHLHLDLYTLNWKKIDPTFLFEAA